ncbi:hypothetical protein BDP81DRAFT_69817 [Colletotrichum phormii]|uniref:Uncharacterized protein n=1 Tax=Colletotrichum phormii TaxID=359342 RepID=A0AAI9ZKJ3_9PEZI|nr:uncharacterized protein BDP81DRAFT_69817 [Colletotrichum phormii]KAK1633688.1 hypothetical protein BDP81DRAFT_69817 [Colletotrichum phormii]
MAVLLMSEWSSLLGRIPSLPGSAQAQTCRLPIVHDDDRRLSEVSRRNRMKLATLPVKVKQGIRGRGCFGLT